MNTLLQKTFRLFFVVILRGNSVPDYLTIEKSIKEVIGKLIELEPGSRGVRCEE